MQKLELGGAQLSSQPCHLGSYAASGCEDGEPALREHQVVGHKLVLPPRQLHFDVDALLSRYRVRGLGFGDHVLECSHELSVDRLSIRRSLAGQDQSAAVA